VAHSGRALGLAYKLAPSCARAAYPG